MLEKVLKISPGVAVFLALFLAAGSGLQAQNEGDQIRSDPDDPVTRVGNRGGNFLELGVGARANALAGAGTAISRGVHSLYWNPAGVARVEAFAVGFSYAEIFESADISHYFAGGLLPFAGGVLGISLNAVTSGDIPRTLEATPSSDNVSAGSTFEWNSTAVGGHYARMITDRLALGASLKWVNEGIEGADAAWVAADAGVRFDTGLYGVTLAASVVNLSGKSRMNGALVEQSRAAASEIFETGRDIDIQLLTDELRLPTLFRFGLQVDLSGTPEALITPNPRHHVTLFGEFADATDTDIQSTVALEYSFSEIIFVRGGKRWMNENLAERDFSDGLSGGFGLRLPVLGRNVSFDYAYTSLLSGLNNTQVFSFEYGF